MTFHYDKFTFDSYISKIDSKSRSVEIEAISKKVILSDCSEINQCIVNGVNFYSCEDAMKNQLSEILDIYSSKNRELQVQYYELSHFICSELERLHKTMKGENSDG